MSFINKNPYFPELIRAELEKAGLKEIGDDDDVCWGIMEITRNVGQVLSLCHGNPKIHLF